MKWNGSVAVITGASRGIGAATALAAARKGASLGLIARDEDDLAAVRKDVENAGATCAIAVADVADTASLVGAIQSLESALGPTDVLVANAGIGSFGAFADREEDEIERIVRVNVLGLVHAVRAVVPGMIERRRGHIVTMNSVAGRIGSPWEAIYAATKFAGVGLSEAISTELAPYGIGVSMINPGPVDTNFGIARGHVYDRKRPKPVSAERVADAVITAVEKNRLETYVPSSFRPAVIVRHLLPGLFRYGTAKSMAKEIAEDRKKRGA